MQVIKRDGEIAEFNPDKIYQAILKAAQTVYVLTDDYVKTLHKSLKKSGFGFGRGQGGTCYH